ncbi:MAG: protein-disulfide isomerase [Gammaproteobacteria bacterium]|nr:protein-disulfide isomerase [Gammaproteobacteria bacterium]
MAILALAAAAAALTLPDALAEDDDGAAAEAAATLVSRLKALRPDIPIENVTASPIPGIYALELAGGTVFYGTEDGRYLFAGDLYQLGDDELVNLAEAGRAELRHELLAGVPRSEMIVFSPAGDTRAAINVFTDVDCGFCQKLHQEVPKLNEMGIEVRYLAYPRAGVGSESYRKIVSAWCAKDPNSALTKLKARQSIPDASCPNPVAEQLDLGRQMGVSGTPAIVLQDGTMLPGYMPAERLAEIVGL